MLSNFQHNTIYLHSINHHENAMSHPLAAQTAAELMPSEQTSVQPGEAAPDFTLPYLPGYGGAEGETLTLSDRLGSRPVAIIFGSYT